MLVRSVCVNQACNVQDMWKWKSARPTTSRKAGYAPASYWIWDSLSVEFWIPKSRIWNSGNKNFRIRNPDCFTLVKSYFLLLLNVSVYLYMYLFIHPFIHSLIYFYFQASVNATDQLGRQAIHLAVQAGCISSIEYLITYHGVDVNVCTGKSQMIPLHLAAKVHVWCCLKSLIA